MGADSKIEWTDHTFNPWVGCQKISPACTNCYAEVSTPTRTHRAKGLELWGPKAARQITSDANWKLPRRWNAKAAHGGPRPRVFCASLADVFEGRADLDAPRERLWRLIEDTPHLDWLLLTKRPENVMRMVPWTIQFPGNVWLGTTVEDQQRADERIPHLLACPAEVRFLSCEPLLGPIDLSLWLGGSDAAAQSRGDCVSGCPERRAIDRRRGADLASRSAEGESLDGRNALDPMRTATRREELGGVPAGSGDGRRETGACLGASVGMAALPGSDPRGADRQPQERYQDGQPPRESGAGDLLRADAPRDPRAGVRAAPQLSWVIVGGESGNHARPMHPNWARGLRDQCVSRGVPFFFKQWGEWAGRTGPGLEHQPRIRLSINGKNGQTDEGEGGHDVWMQRVGKKNAGRELDGRTWDEFPAEAP